MHFKACWARTGRVLFISRPRPSPRLVGTALRLREGPYWLLAGVDFAYRALLISVVHCKTRAFDGLPLTLSPRPLKVDSADENEA